MIAAASPQDSSLGLVQLILSLAATHTQPVPEELKLHLTNVIADAKALLADPVHISNHTNPEAIELALGMKISEELTTAVNQITTFESIKPSLANEVLEQMRGVHPAY